MKMDIAKKKELAVSNISCNFKHASIHTFTYNIEMHCGITCVHDTYA